MVLIRVDAVRVGLLDNLATAGAGLNKRPAVQRRVQQRDRPVAHSARGQSERGRRSTVARRHIERVRHVSVGATGNALVVGSVTNLPDIERYRYSVLVHLDLKPNQNRLYEVCGIVCSYTQIDTRGHMIPWQGLVILSSQCISRGLYVSLTPYPLGAYLTGRVTPASMRARRPAPRGGWCVHGSRVRLVWAAPYNVPTLVVGAMGHQK